MIATLAAVIPTRNRSSLAIEAVRALLDQDCELEIFVSDNSTSADEPLRQFCEAAPRVQYLRPSAERSAASHWDWAVREVLARSQATHVAVLHDRNRIKPRQWGALQSIATQHPDTVITFGIDSIHDTPPPLRLWQMPWTGKLFRQQTARAAAMIAAARIAEALHALPTLANSVVPRAVLTSIVDRFGNLCDSTSPDLAFLSRFLALHDTWLHADRSIGILHAANRSSGRGYLRGAGGDFPDFVELHGDRPWLDAAPLPGLNLGYNMLLHEYELVRRETGDRLPSLDRRASLESLASALQWVQSPEARASMRAALAMEGCVANSVPFVPDRTWRNDVRETMTLLAARWLGRAPEHITAFAFKSDEQALRAALRHPRRAQSLADHMIALEAVEVGS